MLYIQYKGLLKKALSVACIGRAPQDTEITLEEIVLKFVRSSSEADIAVQVAPTMVCYYDPTLPSSILHSP